MKTDSLKEATKARDDFLKEHPHLIPIQQEIDDILNKCREEDRLSVVMMLMMKNALELQKETMKLQEIASKNG